MSDRRDPNDREPHVLCATDFSDLSHRAFYHALRLSLLWSGRFTLLHVGRESRAQVAWQRFPRVLETLIDWRQLPAESSKSAIVDRLGVQVAKKAMRDEDPVAGILDHLQRRPADLLVMGTEEAALSGRSAFNRSSTALRVLRRAQCPTLLLPMGSRDFIDSKSGSSRLSTCLIPVDHDPDARSAIALATRLCTLLASKPVNGVALFVGETLDTPPYVLSSTSPLLRWTKCTLAGDPVAVIAEQAERLACELLVMPIAASRGLRDQLFGTTFDRLVRHLNCPVLAVPTAGISDG